MQSKGVLQQRRRRSAKEEEDGGRLSNRELNGCGADPVSGIFPISTLLTADQGNAQDGRFAMSIRDIQVGLALSPDGDNSKRIPLPMPPGQTTVPT